MVWNLSARPGLTSPIPMSGLKHSRKPGNAFDHGLGNQQPIERIAIEKGCQSLYTLCLITLIICSERAAIEYETQDNKRDMNMSDYRKNTMSMVLCTFIVSVIAITASVPAQAGGAGAFLGGIAVARIGQNMRDRTDYEQDQAYYAQQQASIAQAQAAAPSASSAEEKIKKLDKLLAGGYITKDEYNTQKQKILNNL